MATDTYSIQIQTEQAQSALAGLKGALGGLSAALVVSEFIKLSDSVTNMQNKLRSMTPDVQEVRNQFAGLSEIAMRSRTDLETVVTTYSRLVKAGKEVGMTQLEAAKITETLAKALQTAGSSTAEINSVMIQLTQAFQSGKLAGDEFRSIMENMPVTVIQAFAKELGVPVGQLKELASEGKITADVIKTALLNVSQSVNEEYGRTIPTVSSAFENLKTAVATAFANFDQNTQLGAKLAEAMMKLAEGIVYVSNNIDSIIGPLKVLGTIVAGLLAYTLVGRAFQALGLAFTAVRAVVTSLVPLWQSLVTAGQSLMSIFTNSGPITAFGNAVGATVGPIKAAAQAAAGLIASAATYLGLGDWWNGKSGEAPKVSGPEIPGLPATAQTEQGTTTVKTNPYFSNEARLNAEQMAQKMAEMAQMGQTILTSYQSTNAEKLKELEFQNSLIGLKDTEKQKAQELHTAQIDFFKTITPLQEQYEKLSKSANDQDQQLATVIKGKIDEITQAHEQYRIKLTEILDEKAKALEAAKKQEEAEKLIAQQAERRRQIEADIDKLKASQAEKVTRAQQALDLKGLSGVQREMRRIQYEEQNWADAAKNRIREQWGGGDETELNARLAEIDAIRDKTIADLQGIAQQSQNIESQNLGTQQRITQGWGNSMSQMRQYSQDATGSIGGMFNGMASGISNAIMGFVQTGKFQLSSLKGLIQPLISGGLNALFGGGGGRGGGGGGLFGNLFGGGGNGGFGQLNTSINGLTDQFSQFNARRGPLGTGADPSFMRVAGGLDPLQNSINGLGGTFNNGFGQLGNTFQSGIGGLGNSLSGLLGGLGSTLSNVIGGLGKGLGGIFSGITNSIGGLFGGGGKSGGGGLFSSIGSGISSLFSGVKNLFSGFFATGGVIPGGKFGVVGERGPEFVSGPARITPMDEMGMGNQTVIYNINAVDALSFRELVARDPSFIHAVAMKGAQGTPRRR